MPQPLSNEIIWTDWVVPNGGIDESRSDHELDQKRWASALDVEPLPTGCRNRNGKTKVNAIAAPAVVIANTTGTNVRQISNATVTHLAQGITGTAATAAAPLTGIAIRINVGGGVPATNVSCAIYTDTAGKPNAAVTGLDFANFNTVTAASIIAQGGFQWIRFTPTTATTLANGTLYHIVIKSTVGSGVNYYEVTESTAGNPYAGGTVNSGTAGPAWTIVAAADLVFRVYCGASAITGILDYNLSDATTERVLIAAGGEVYKEVTGVLTSVSAIDLALMDATADVHPAMTVGSDMAFISNAIDTPKKFFIRSATERWANDGISPPTATPTPAIVAGGSLEVGAWYVDYYYWDDLLGTKSNTRYQGATSLIATTTGGNQTINLSGLPSTVARVGDRATHLRISLKAPSGSIFRFAGTAQGQITLGTTTASITTDALTNEPDYDDDIAPLHSIAAVGANQRFIAGIAATPWRVMASKLSVVAPFYESFPSLSYRDFGRGDGDYVTALAFISPATLIVGMKNSVWALDARRFLTADPVLIAKNVGVAGPNALMVVGRVLFFVSDSDRTKGLMLWDGSKVTPLTSIDKTFKTLLPGRIKYATCAHLAPGDNRFQWWTLITASGTAQNRVIVYDYALDAFSVYRHSGNVLGSASVGGSISRVKIGGTDGFMYDADLGSTDNGTGIVGTFKAKRFDYGQPDTAKRVRFVRAEGDGAADSSLTVQFEPDVQGFASFSGVLDFNGSVGSLLGTGVLGLFMLGANGQIISTRAPLHGMCRNAQPTFSSSTRWSLRGYAVGVQPTRRR